MKKIVRFFKQVISKIKHEQQARKSFKEWEKKIKPVNDLNAEDRKLWYEEEQEKWRAWYGED